MFYHILLELRITIIDFIEYVLSTKNVLGISDLSQNKIVVSFVWN